MREAIAEERFEVSYAYMVLHMHISTSITKNRSFACYLTMRCENVGGSLLSSTGKISELPTHPTRPSHPPTKMGQKL